MSNGTQHTIEEKLNILWSTNGIYEVARLKLLGWLILIFPCKEKKSKAENQNYGGSMEIKKHECGKLNTVKTESITQRHIWCQHLEMDWNWTLLGQQSISYSGNRSRDLTECTAVTQYS